MNARKPAARMPISNAVLARREVLESFLTAISDTYGKLHKMTPNESALLLIRVEGSGSYLPADTSAQFLQGTEHAATYTDLDRALDRAVEYQRATGRETSVVCLYNAYLDHIEDMKEGIRQIAESRPLGASK